MKEFVFRVKGSETRCLFSASIKDLPTIVLPVNSIILTDENVLGFYRKKIANYRYIVIKAGEAFKTVETVQYIINELITLKADRSTTLIGMGGGVVTDIAGYVASIYMRGIPFGFIPTTLLAMVDASIGGKNGIDIGQYKNMVGVIKQPNFLLYDISLLKTLPQQEWSNGFAEIIKHAAIKDAKMFKVLQGYSLKELQKATLILSELVRQNALLKMKVVKRDQFEKGDRKLLNFGHTLGHAIEQALNLPHGYAVSIGMVYAAKLSEKLSGFTNAQAVIDLLQQYDLPVTADFNMKDALKILSMDKKRESDSINYILLKTIGQGIIYKLPLETLSARLLEMH